MKLFLLIFNYFFKIKHFSEILNIFILFYFRFIRCYFMFIRTTFAVVCFLCVVFSLLSLNN